MQIPRSSSFFEECFRQSTWIRHGGFAGKISEKSPAKKHKKQTYYINPLRGFTLWLFNIAIENMAHRNT